MALDVDNLCVTDGLYEPHYDAMANWSRISPSNSLPKVSHGISTLYQKIISFNTENQLAVISFILIQTWSSCPTKIKMILCASLKVCPTHPTSLYDQVHRMT